MNLLKRVQEPLFILGQSTITGITKQGLLSLFRKKSRFLPMVYNVKSRWGRGEDEGGETCLSSQDLWSKYVYHSRSLVPQHPSVFVTN